MYNTIRHRPDGKEEGQLITSTSTHTNTTYRYYY